MRFHTKCREWAIYVEARTLWAMWTWINEENKNQNIKKSCEWNGIFRFFYLLSFSFYLFSSICRDKKCKLPWQFLDEFSACVCKLGGNLEFSISWKDFQPNRKTKKRKKEEKRRGKQYISCVEFRFYEIRFEFSFSLLSWMYTFCTDVVNIHLKCDRIFHRLMCCGTKSALAVTVRCGRTVHSIYDLFAVLIMKL